MIDLTTAYGKRHAAIAAELRAEPTAYVDDLAGRIMAALALVAHDLPQCCVCGSVNVTYHNYEGKPFCLPCSNGEGVNSPLAANTFIAANPSLLQTSGPRPPDGTWHLFPKATS